MDALLDAVSLRRLLGELAGRLQHRGVRVNLYIVGGAAIAMQFDERRATRDIDSVVLEGHGPLMAEVVAMAREHGLPTTWLNDQATMYVSTTPDPGRQLASSNSSLTRCDPRSSQSGVLVVDRRSGRDDQGCCREELPCPVD